MRLSRLTLGLLLWALTAHADFRRNRTDGWPHFRFSTAPADTGAAPAPPAPPIFQLLAEDSTAGIGTAGDVCTVYSSSLVGNYFCLKGDGTSVNSSADTLLSAQGTPTTETSAHCPNSRDCTSRSRQNLNGTSQYWRTPATLTSPTGDFSACATLRVVGESGDNHIVTRFNAGLDSFFFRYSAPDFGLYINSASGANQVTAGVGGARWSLHHVCGTYQYVGDGTSVGRIYIDGTQVNSASNLKGPPLAGATRTAIGSYSNGAGYWQGSIFNALYTETLLSAGTVAAMAATSLPPLTGAAGEVVTTTRASGRACLKSNGTGVNLAGVNRPCWNANGLSVESDGTNLVLQNRLLSNAAWTKTSMSCSTTRVLGVDGTLSGASCTATGTNGTVKQTVTTGAATRATSFYVKRLVGTGTVTLTRDNFGSETDITASINSSTYTRFCISSGGANPTVGVRVATSGDFVAVDYVQDEVGALCTSAIYTEGSGVQRIADVVTTPTIATGSTPSFAGYFTRRTADTAGHLVNFYTGANDRWLLYTSGSDLKCEYYDGSAHAVTSTGGLAVGDTKRVSCGYDGTNLQVCVDSVCTTAAHSLTLPSTFTTIRYGYDATSAGSARYGEIGDFRVCNTPTGCT